MMSTERPIERLAAALQDCLNEAAHKAADRAAHKAAHEAADRAADRAAHKVADHVADQAAHKAAQEVKADLMPRLDRQDATLRLMWKQMKGNGKLPVDEP